MTGSKGAKPLEMKLSHGTDSQSYYRAAAMPHVGMTPNVVKLNRRTSCDRREEHDVPCTFVYIIQHANVHSEISSYTPKLSKSMRLYAASQPANPAVQPTVQSTQVG